MRKIGVICGLPIEARCLVKRSLPIGSTFNLTQNIVVHTAGMGKEQAKAAAENLIQQGAEGLISWGTAGGLSPKIYPGDLLLPSHVINHEQETFSVDQNWRKDLRDNLNNLVVHDGILLQTNQIITSIHHKRQLFETYQALAVDMESAAVAAVALAAKIPFLVIRTVVDDASFNFPQWLHLSLNARGKVLLGSLSQKLMIQPSRIKDLVRLAQSFASAKATLNSVGALLSTEKVAIPTELLV